MWASAHWLYIAPKRLEKRVLKTLVRPVQFPHYDHLPLYCYNYATHYTFKGDAQAFDVVREFTRYHQM